MKRLQQRALIGALMLLAGCAREPESKISFSDQVQPILSDNCYGCHGPSSSSRKAGLRLDRAEAAYAPHEKFGPAIVPGEPDKSPLIQRIEAADKKQRMPPPEAHKTLKPEQIALLRQWVEEGAHYEPHWSFIAPVRPAMPKNAAADNWARNDIDRLVFERLAKDQLAPSPEADKRSLIRRVTYALTGLPPSVQEVDALLADVSPDAYDKVVDRLLASSRYGEHRAHYWLDYVRYADTHGLHFDNYRAIWPYRDYVIGAYNQNKPFDAFVREQLAGDLLPKQTLETLIATGYMRSNPTTNEGGTIPEEVFVNLTRDRVETFGVAFLGLTTGCAVCHDHKFDPTTQKDVYQLSAFLNNTADGPMDFNSPDPPPVIRLPDDKDRALYEKLVSERGDLLARLSARRDAAPELLRAQFAAGKKPQAVSTDQLELRLRFDEGKGETLHNSAAHPAVASFKTESVPLIWGETEWLWPGARFDTNTRLPLGKTGDVEADEAFSAGGWVMLRATSVLGEMKALMSRMGDPKGSHKAGWGIFQRYKSGIFFSNQYPAASIYVNLANDSLTPEPPPAQNKPASPKKPKKSQHFTIPQPAFEPMKRAIQVRTVQGVPSEQWAHVFITYDGSRKAQGVRIYLNGKPAETEIMNDSLRAQDSIRTEAVTHLGRREDDGAALRETRYQDMRFYRRALSAEEVVRLPFEDFAAEIVAKQSDPAKWAPSERFAVLERYFLAAQDSQAKQLKTDIESLQARINALAPEPTSEERKSTNPTNIFDGQRTAGILRKLIEQRPSSLIAQEKSTPAYAYTLKRGDYSSRSERVGPGTPHFLPALTTGSPNRLALANWLFTAENPLFARVAINRMWQELFGVGLVESAGDFGLMGDRPSNQKLLDWLAVEFRESNWDVKHMYRLMATSAAYRQSANVTPELLRADPANRLLTRGPRFRMDAEEIRDSALAAAGLLVEKIGGPPVKPYSPPGLWEEVSMNTSNTREYVKDGGESLYRRSVYSFVKRASPLPSMETFDAASRETVCARRPRANTPLQALTTLNDPQFIEAARMLARTALRAKPDEDGRLDAMAQITLSRPLDPEEKAIFIKSQQAFAQRFASRPQSAQALLAIGDTPPDKSLRPGELAAWTLVASQFLNLDEFITK